MKNIVRSPPNTFWAAKKSQKFENNNLWVYLKITKSIIKYLLNNCINDEKAGGACFVY